MGAPLALSVEGDAHRPNRTFEGNPGQHEGGAGGVDRQHVVGVLLVGAEDGDDDLGLVAVAGGEAWPERAVDEPGGENGGIGRPSLPAKERPGDLARRVHALFDVDGEGEEVNALPHGGGAVGGGEHHRFADLCHHCALRLLGQEARLQREGQRRSAYGS